MASFMIGDTAAHIGRPCWFAVARGVEEVGYIYRAVGAAGVSPCFAQEALHIRASATASSESHVAKVGAGQVGGEVSAENSDKRRNIWQGNLDVAVEAPRAYQGRVEPRRIVTGGNDDDALALPPT